MRISDWSSDVCSSDLSAQFVADVGKEHGFRSIGPLRMLPCLLQQFLAVPQIPRHPIEHRHGARPGADLVTTVLAWNIGNRFTGRNRGENAEDRKSTRLNSSH